MILCKFFQKLLSFDKKKLHVEIYNFISKNNIKEGYNNPFSWPGWPSPPLIFLKTKQTKKHKQTNKHTKKTKGQWIGHYHEFFGPVSSVLHSGQLLADMPVLLSHPGLPILTKIWHFCEKKSDPP